jgi:hypothetical protein
MKLFNLEEAMAGKPVMTVGGHTFIFGAYNPEMGEASVIGWIVDPHEGYISHATNELGYAGGMDMRTDEDLVMADPDEVKRISVIKNLETKKWCLIVSDPNELTGTQIMTSTDRQKVIFEAKRLYSIDDESDWPVLLTIEGE